MRGCRNGEIYKNKSEEIFAQPRQITWTAIHSEITRPFKQI